MAVSYLETNKTSPMLMAEIPAQVACTSGDAGSICAFFQSGASGTANDAFHYMQEIIDHGCKLCGSVPTQPGNNVANGQLTVNAVSKPCCEGTCHC
jgi:hypothetical protein